MTATLLTMSATRDPHDHRPHRLHGEDRIWVETNCSVDVWVELLTMLGLDPVAGLAFTLSSDFDGSQWSFIKYPVEDVRRLYGIDVAELNVWRPVVEHVVEHLDRGNLLTVEVDAFFLPDTAGVSYGVEHSKTTIVPVALDLPGRRAAYLHGRGMFDLTGDDFDGIFAAGRAALPPYVELLRMTTQRPADDELVRSLARDHLARRNPNAVDEFADRMRDDVANLTGAGAELFHKWAFGTIRQFGSTAELAADFADLVSAGDSRDIGDRLRRASEAAKTIQLQFARAARGRAIDIETGLGELTALWNSSLADLATLLRA